MRTTSTLITGVIVLALTLGAWLWGETHGVRTEVIWSIVPSILLALLVGQQAGDAADAAKQAATQTNGQLDARVRAAVGAALADRDAARTFQAQVDSQSPPPPTP